ASALSAAGSTAGIESFAFFILAMGFMIASLIVAQKMGANGATAAINIGQRVRRGTQSYVTGGAAKFTRNKIDKYASSDKDTFGSRTISRILTHTGVRDYLDKTYEKSTAKSLSSRSRTISQGLSARDTAAENKRHITKGIDTATDLLVLKERREL